MARKITIVTNRGTEINLRVADNVYEALIASESPAALVVDDLELYLLSRYSVYHYPIWLTNYQCRRLLRELDRYERITKINF